MKYLFLLLIITLSNSLFAQLDSLELADMERDEKEFPGIGWDYHMETHYSLLVGYNYNFHSSHFLELGMGIYSSGVIGYHFSTNAITLSGECRINKWNNPVIGPKLSFWTAGGAGGMVLGSSFVYYVTQNDNSLIFRPEVGFGLGNFRITYGYDIPFNKEVDIGLARHNIGIVVLVSLKRIRKVKKWPDWEYYEEYVDHQ